VVFWQLTFDANDPALLARFWEQALGWVRTPPAEPQTTWWEHYRSRLGDESEFEDRLFDPEGLRPALWFQWVPEEKAGKNRLHLDLYPTGRDGSLSIEERIDLVDRMVGDLLVLGATVLRHERWEDGDEAGYFITLQDPEGNEFCVS
jgi:predicted enzyme related to lactoylglutathione lyase